MSGGSDAEIVAQIRTYQKNQSIKSGNTADQECQGEDNFDYCWEQSQDQSSTPARPIPGHTKPKPAAKSPRSPRSDLTKSPSNSSSKSPGSRETGGRSPKSPVLSEFVGLSDHELRKLKISLLAQESNNER